VVDVRLFRSTMLEVGGQMVEADRSIGRLVHVPNGIVSPGRSPITPKVLSMSGTNSRLGRRTRYAASVTIGGRNGN
jgi:protein subunit release factor A